MNVGFVGCGQMATALVKGIARKSQSQTRIYAFDPNSTALNHWTNELKAADTVFSPCKSNQDVLDCSQFVFLAVKPQVAEQALTNLVPNESNIFVSVIAGTSIQRLGTLLNSNSVIRAMPNTPCLIGQGATAVSALPGTKTEDLNFVLDVFSSVGKVVKIEEKWMDAVTGLSGSGPAYVFTFIESLIDAGVLAGLSREIARELALQTVRGAAELVEQSGATPASLRDQVTSPGGTTVHGMEKLEQSGFRAGIMSAVKAATKRSIELGR